MARQKRKTRYVMVRLDEDERRTLEVIAEGWHSDLSTAVRRLIQERAPMAHARKGEKP